MQLNEAVYQLGAIPRPSVKHDEPSSDIWPTWSTHVFITGLNQHCRTLRVDVGALWLVGRRYLSLESMELVLAAEQAQRPGSEVVALPAARRAKPTPTMRELHDNSGLDREMSVTRYPARGPTGIGYGLQTNPSSWRGIADTGEPALLAVH